MGCPHCGVYSPGTSVVNFLVKRAAAMVGSTPAELTGPARLKRLCRARYAVMAAASRKGLSSVQIGRALGNRDHTTILAGLARAGELSADRDFRVLVADLETAE